MCLAGKDVPVSELRVMTYNMLHAPGDRLQSLFDVVHAAQPDILACQEIDDIPGLLELSYRLGMPAVIGHSNRPEDPPAAEHLAVLSRFPIVQLHIHPGDPDAMFRHVLEVWIAPPGAPVIRCFVVHFRAFVGTPGSEVKMREAEHLCGLLAEAQAPYLALGDFNALSPAESEVPAGWGADMPEDHRAAVLGGVVSRLLKVGIVDTWRQINDPAAVPAGTLRGGRSARVDYIWADPDSARSVADSTIIRTAKAEQASDHYPVVTTFRFPDPS
jgi:endonuclease/exonuclease/phosphatase family metal-dependent hydrolase